MELCFRMELPFLKILLKILFLLILFSSASFIRSCCWARRKNSHYRNLNARMKKRISKITTKFQWIGHLMLKVWKSFILFAKTIRPNRTIKSFLNCHPWRCILMSFYHQVWRITSVSGCTLIWTGMRRTKNLFNLCLLWELYPNYAMALELYLVHYAIITCWRNWSPCISSWRAVSRTMAMKGF